MANQKQYGIFKSHLKTSMKNELPVLVSDNGTKAIQVLGL